MTKNMAARGEGLAGLAKEWREMAAHEGSEEDLAYKLGMELAAEQHRRTRLTLEKCIADLAALEATASDMLNVTELAEHITYKIQSLLTDKYTNSFKIACGVIGQELQKAVNSMPHDALVGEAFYCESPAATQEQPADADTGFHAQDGWMFKRMEDGSVRILRGDTFVVLPENSWASVVCSVSKLGETHSRWQEIRFFHGTESVRRWNGHAQKWEWV